MKHVLLRNPRLNGWEYGMLRALEEEIVLQTGATCIDIPWYGSDPILKRAGHGMRWQGLRSLLPAQKLQVEADVVWTILMGPEDCDLDLFTGWQQAKYRIVYLFDTLPPQFPVIKKLFSGNDFNVRITSFNDAIPVLEQLTGKQWHVIEQAVPAALFEKHYTENKDIHFSSYGRRWPVFHETLMEFCHANGLYYDFTTHDGRHPTAPSEQLYNQYAWHINHSLFTISWPVELTNPARAGNLHPITCRWFEAAAAGTVVIGQKPANHAFDEYLFSNMVTAIDPFEAKEKIWKQLDNIWSRREELFAYAQAMRTKHLHRLTWTERVQRIQRLLENQDF